MIGGTVIGVTIYFRDSIAHHTRLLVRDDHHPSACMVYVNGLPFIRPGDSVWWQSGRVYHRVAGTDLDFTYQKLGNSSGAHVVRVAE